MTTKKLGFGPMRFLGLGALLVWCPAALAHDHVTIPYFLAASEYEDPNEGRQGFVRIINHSDSAGMVTVTAVDDAGNEKTPFTVALGPRQTRAFNSDDLETNPGGKGFLANADGTAFMGVGQPQLSDGVPGGHWRLRIAADDAIGADNVEALEYIRTRSGFLTTMHDAARERDADGGMKAYHVRIFNPGSNRRQLSKLYLINNNADSAAAVTIVGVDDAGMPGDADVTFTLGGGKAAEIPSQALEGIATAEDLMGAVMPEGGLTGALGDGAGKWQLFITSDQSLSVLSLMTLPGGYLSNLSTTTSTMDFSPPARTAPPPEPPSPPAGEDEYATTCEGLEVAAGRISYGPLNDDPGGLGSLDACATTHPLIDPINELANPIDMSVTTVHEAKWQTRADSNSAWMDIDGTAVEFDVCPHDPGTTAGEYRMAVDQTVTPEGGEPNRFKCSSNTITVE